MKRNLTKKLIRNLFRIRIFFLFFLLPITVVLANDPEERKNSTPLEREIQNLSENIQATLLSLNLQNSIEGTLEKKKPSVIETIDQFFQKQFQPYDPQQVPNLLLIEKFRHYLEIFKFFHSWNRIFPHLKKLEVLCSDSPSFKEKGEAKTFLLEELEREEQKQGFQRPTDVRDNLTIEAFNDLLQSKIPFNDLFFDNSPHGDLTHRLQWYLIAQELNEPEGPLRSKLPPAIKNAGDLYQLLGKENLKGLIWDALFDSFVKDKTNPNFKPREKENKNNLTIPEYLNTEVLALFPCLGTINKMKWQKQLGQVTDSGTSSQAVYEGVLPKKTFQVIEILESDDDSVGEGKDI